MHIFRPFESVSYSFFLFQVVVYEFHSLLKSVHAGQQFACSRKKDNESYHSDTDSLSTCHALRSITHLIYVLFTPVLTSLS